jgi:hypothetical protein
MGAISPTHPSILSGRIGLKPTTELEANFRFALEPLGAFSDQIRQLVLGSVGARSDVRFTAAEPHVVEAETGGATLCVPRAEGSTEDPI